MSAVFASHGVSAAAVSAGTRGTRASSSAHGTKFVQSSKRRFASTVALYAVSEPEAETATEEPEQPAVPELSKVRWCRVEHIMFHNPRVESDRVSSP